MKYVVEKELSDGDIQDILDTAYENAIGYWACLDNTTPEWEESRRAVKAAGMDGFCSQITMNLWGVGQSVRLLDAESEDMDNPDDVWMLSFKDFQKGCALYEQHRGSIKKCLDDGAFDAIEADCLIQYAVFGDIIYG